MTGDLPIFHSAAAPQSSGAVGDSRPGIEPIRTDTPPTERGAYPPALRVGDFDGVYKLATVFKSAVYPGNKVAFWESEPGILCRRCSGSRSAWTRSPTVPWPTPQIGAAIDRKAWRCNESAAEIRQAGQARRGNRGARLPAKQRKCLMIVVADGGEENPAKARALEEHLRAYPKDVEDYDWIGIITGVPRSAGFGQWSAAQDVAAGQDAEQESMPARRAGDSSATRAVGHMPGR